MKTKSLFTLCFIILYSAFCLSARAQSTANASIAASAGSLNGTLPASQLTGTVPLAQLPGAIVTNNASGAVLNGTFIGNGAGVTNVQLTTINSSGAITWPGNFAPGSTLPVGGTPHSVVAADVNGDGWRHEVSDNGTIKTLIVSPLTGNRFHHLFKS